MYDIVFISFNEPNADRGYLDLLKNIVELDNSVHRIHGVKGIHQAHIEAAKVAKTKMFWVVDADAIILPNFKFNIKFNSNHISVNFMQLKHERNAITASIEN